MSCSDYVSLKRKKNVNSNTKFNKSQNTSSNYTEALELSYIQNTIILNEDNENTNINRFNIEIKNIIKPTKNIHSLPLIYSIPKMRINEYVKNRYQSPFCWTCFTPINEILNDVACDLCKDLMTLADVTY